MKSTIYGLLMLFGLTTLPLASAQEVAISEQLKSRYPASTVRVSTNEKQESEGLFSISGPLKVSIASQSFKAGATTQRDPALATAMQFLSDNAELFTTTEAGFTLKKRNSDKFGMQHFRFLRTINKIPVADMEVIVHVNADNTITGVNGNIVRASQLLLDHMTQVDHKSLLDKATAFTRVSALRGEQPQSLRLLNAELLLFSSAPHIRWHIDLNSTAQVGRYSYWLNAETGDLIDVKNTLRHPIPIIR